jgi:hypothetical protein
MAQAQGSLAQVLMQMEHTFGVVPTNVKSKKVYCLPGMDIGSTQESIQSNTMRGGSRQPSQGARGKTDAGGNLPFELQANIPAYYAAFGSMESVMTGGVMGTAMTTPTATIDAVAQLMTINSTTHGCTVGDSVEITLLTAPTTLNAKVWPVVAVPTANQFIIRIPMGTTSTFTIGPGAIKRVTTPGTTFTHTLKAGGNLPSYTIEKGFTDVTFGYYKELGCKCGELGFGVGPSGLIEAKSTWMAANEAAPASTSFDVAPLDNGMRGFDNLGISSANIKEGGTAAADILSMDFTVNNDLDGDTYLVGGQGYRGSINSGIFSLKGSLKALYQGETAASYLDKARSRTETSLEFTVVRGTGAGTDGNESLQVILPELNYERKSPPIANTKGVVVELSFTGFYDNATQGTALVMVLKNAIAPGALI